jgi:putative SOS response-associated peptidase YedK
MCQRYSLALAKEKVVSEFPKLSFSKPYEANFNIAPGGASYIITNKDMETAQMVQWGLIPHWSKSGEQTETLFNARSEGIASKASFRIPIRNSRCLVLADSFYVWRNANQTGDVFRVVPRDGSLLCFAGIYDTWAKEDKKKLSFTVITHSSNKEVSQVTESMPVILNGEDRNRWLQSNNLMDCLEILKTSRSGVLHLYKITDRIKDINYNTIDLHSRILETHTLFDL